jgi:N-acetylmuramoyl-L-alanine amidase
VFLPIPARAALLLALLLIASVGQAADVATRLKAEEAVLAKLRADPASVNRRDLWQALDGRLAALAKAAPDAALGARVLYYQAWANEELAKRSVLDKDYEAAAALYARVVATAPGHAFADDALLRRASIMRDALKRPDEARADLTRLLATHPTGDMAARARTLLAGLDKESPPGGSPARPAVPARAPDPPATPKRPALLSRLAVTPSDTGTRLTLSLDRETTYRYQVLDQPRPGGEPVKRLYIDLDNTRTGAEIPSEKRFDSGNVTRLRAGYFTPETVRVVLELDKVAHYELHAETTPFRVVLDLTAAQAAAPGHPAEHRAEAAAPDGDRASRIVSWLGNVFRDPNKIADPGPSPKGKDPGRHQAGETRQPASPPPPDPLLRSNFRPGREQKKRVGDLLEQLGLSVRTVMIDPGHGGKDPGAQGLFGLVEKDVNLRLARLLGEALAQRGFKVLYTRTTDVFIPLETRTEMANTEGADLFVSVHCNAHANDGTSGLETYSLNLANSQDAVRVAARENAASSKRISDLQAILTDLMLSAKTIESRDLARLVQKRILGGLGSRFGTRDRGPHEAPFFVLIGANMPAVLVEVGYITNPAEARRLASTSYLRALADGLADGIVAYKKKIERYANL